MLLNNIMSHENKHDVDEYCHELWYKTIH